MNKIILATVAAVSASPVFASGTCIPNVNCTPVPEISALEGTAALAAVAAIVLLAWERRRRAA